MDIRRGREIHKWHKQQLGHLHRQLSKNKEKIEETKKDREETDERDQRKEKFLRELEEAYHREREQIINEIRRHERAVRAINQLEFERKYNENDRQR